MAENEDEEVRKINDWFNNLENSLKELFDQNDLKLKYKKKEFNYKIEYGNSSFGLNELSDGYSAVLSIITELILRMEVHNMGTYDLQGVVLIDELETHLHVGLQKKILPFLTKFFPKIQFIITTHSPFILSSLKDVVICDLERKIITGDLSAYSYESLVDSYFDLDKYSIKIQNDIQIYRELKQKYLNQNLSEDEQIQFVELEIYLENIPKYNNEEIGLSIKEIKEMV
jgi:predicted ATP-binding protein involved in virulence